MRLIKAKPLTIVVAIAAAFLPGCLGAPANPAATQPTTAIDPKTAEPGYWYDQPGVASVETPDFDTLWKACKLAARDDGFILDRPGYRDGVMTTQPLTSKQFFEPWLNDVADGHSLVQSSLATMRRTVRFEMTKIGEGPAATWQCVPKVLVERFQEIERRITNAIEYTQAFVLTKQQASMQEDRERDPTAGVPPLYWYPVGRDPALERQLAGLIREHVKA
jgi:hypothetical protein